MNSNHDGRQFCLAKIFASEAKSADYPPIKSISAPSWRSVMAALEALRLRGQ